MPILTFPSLLSTRGTCMFTMKKALKYLTFFAFCSCTNSIDVPVTEEKNETVRATSNANILQPNSSINTKNDSKYVFVNKPIIFESTVPKPNTMSHNNEEDFGHFSLSTEGELLVQVINEIGFDYFQFSIKRYEGEQTFSIFPLAIYLLLLEKDISLPTKYEKKVSALNKEQRINALSEIVNYVESHYDWKLSDKSNMLFQSSYIPSSDSKVVHFENNFSHMKKKYSTKAMILLTKGVSSKNTFGLDCLFEINNKKTCLSSEGSFKEEYNSTYDNWLLEEAALNERYQKLRNEFHRGYDYNGIRFVVSSSLDRKIFSEFFNFPLEEPISHSTSFSFSPPSTNTLENLYPSPRPDVEDNDWFYGRFYQNKIRFYQKDENINMLTQMAFFYKEPLPG